MQGSEYLIQGRKNLKNWVIQLILPTNRMEIDSLEKSPRLNLDQDKIGNRLGYEMILPIAGGLEPNDLKGPFPPKPFYDAMFLYQDVYSQCFPGRLDGLFFPVTSNNGALRIYLLNLGIL